MLEVEIKEEYIDEAIRLLSASAVSSRQEEGCLHFELIRVGDSNKLVTVEVFVNEDAITVHKKMPYVKAWGAFQYGELKPVESKKVSMCDVVNFAPSVAILPPKGIAIVLEVEIKEEHIDEFVRVMNASAIGSRQEEGCIGYNLLRIKERNTFISYELFNSADAKSVHMDMPYVKAWGAFQYGELKPVVSKSVLNGKGISMTILAPAQETKLDSAQETTEQKKELYNLVDEIKINLNNLVKIKSTILEFLGKINKQNKGSNENKILKNKINELQEEIDNSNGKIVSYENINNILKDLKSMANNGIYEWYKKYIENIICKAFNEDKEKKELCLYLNSAINNIPKSFNNDDKKLIESKKKLYNKEDDKDSINEIIENIYKK